MSRSSRLAAGNKACLWFGWVMLGRGGACTHLHTPLQLPRLKSKLVTATKSHLKANKVYSTTKGSISKMLSHKNIHQDKSILQLGKCMKTFVNGPPKRVPAPSTSTNEESFYLIVTCWWRIRVLRFSEAKDSGTSMPGFGVSCMHWKMGYNL